MRRVLMCRERLLGANHVSTLISVNNLASLLQAISKLDEAEPLFRPALDGLSSTLDHQHKHTLAAKKSLAILIRSKNALKFFSSSGSVKSRTTVTAPVVSFSCLKCDHCGGIGSLESKLRACSRCHLVKYWYASHFSFMCSCFVIFLYLLLYSSHSSHAVSLCVKCCVACSQKERCPRVY